MFKKSFYILPIVSLMSSTAVFASNPLGEGSIPPKTTQAKPPVPLVLKPVPAKTVVKVAAPVPAKTVVKAAAPAPANHKWNKTFTMSNKMVVTHMPDGINIDMAGLNMSVGESYTFGKNSSMNGIKPSADGVLKTSMTIDQFRVELKKFGTIASEK